MISLFVREGALQIEKACYKERIKSTLMGKETMKDKQPPPTHSPIHAYRYTTSQRRKGRLQCRRTEPWQNSIADLKGRETFEESRMPPSLHIF